MRQWITATWEPETEDTCSGIGLTLFPWESRSDWIRSAKAYAMHVAPGHTEFTVSVWPSIAAYDKEMWPQ
jgi:hypothetical protein